MQCLNSFYILHNRHFGFFSKPRLLESCGIVRHSLYLSWGLEMVVFRATEKILKLKLFKNTDAK